MERKQANRPVVKSEVKAFNKEAFSVGNNTMIAKTPKTVLTKKVGFDMKSWGVASGTKADVNDSKNGEDTEKAEAPSVD